MKRIVKITVIIIFVTTHIASWAQENIFDLSKTSEERGDTYFRSLAYASAIDSYKMAYDKNQPDSSLMLKIAESYRLLNDPENALQWYEKVMDKGSFSNYQYYLHYADALSSTKQYAKAKEWYQKYSLAMPSDSRVKKKIEQLNALQQLYSKSSEVTIEEAPFNSPQSDFSPAFYGNGLAFVSSRNTEKPLQPTFNWDKTSYLDIYKYSNGEITKFDKKINSKYHEGPMVFFDNNRKIIFTRNNLRNGKIASSKNGVTKLKLFFAIRNERGWSNAVPLRFNSDEYSVGHPTVSSDGLTMYFASDMPGGAGGVDIYKTEFADGEWQQPVNMGDKINTEGDEMFPYLFNDKELYFASNGQGGMGGLDIFGIDITKENARVINLGAPLNSNLDDFGILINPDGQSGYLSSNRNGGTNKDDIFSFVSNVPLLQNFQVFGTIADGKSHDMIPEATIEVLDEKGNILDEVKTDENGNYTFSVEQGKSYKIKVRKDEYLPKEDIVLTSGDNYEWRKDISINKDLNFNLVGFVRNKESQEPIDGVKVTIIDNIAGSNPEVLQTSEEGKFEYLIDKYEMNDRISYQIKLEKQGYLSKLNIFNAALKEAGDINLNEEMDLALDKIDLGTDIGKLVDVKPIYFDLGKYNIRPDAASELDKIVNVMKANPNIRIELGSHTDARGSQASNMKLSDKRAKSSADYIISQGISPDRIVGKGYGESKLINHCKDGVTCTEEEHQENRRTEFKVTGM